MTHFLVLCSRYWRHILLSLCMAWLPQMQYRRQLHCSQITACVLYGLIPSLCSFISRVWSGSYLRFELPVNRYRRQCLSIPNVTVCFCPNCPGSSVSKAIHSHDKVRQPCLYSKDSEGVFKILRPKQNCPHFTFIFYMKLSYAYSSFSEIWS